MLSRSECLEIPYYLQPPIRGSQQRVLPTHQHCRILRRLSVNREDFLHIQLYYGAALQEQHGAAGDGELGVDIVVVE